MYAIKAKDSILIILFGKTSAVNFGVEWIKYTLYGLFIGYSIVSYTAF